MNPAPADFRRTACNPYTALAVGACGPCCHASFGAACPVCRELHCIFEHWHLHLVTPTSTGLPRHSTSSSDCVEHGHVYGSPGAAAGSCSLLQPCPGCHAGRSAQPAMRRGLPGQLQGCRWSWQLLWGRTLSSQPLLCSRHGQRQLSSRYEGEWQLDVFVVLESLLPDLSHRLLASWCQLHLIPSHTHSCRSHPLFQPMHSRRNSHVTNTQPS